MGNTIEFTAGDHQVPGYLATPAADSAPGIVVIQEWWGLNAHIKDVADRWAAAGYVAIAPDLYYGEVSTEPNEARKLAMRLDRPRAIRDIQGAVDHLLSLDAVRGDNVGVTGFCMGGGLALWMALDGRNVGAVSAYYGYMEFPPETAAQVKAPVQGHFAEFDRGVPWREMKQYGENIAAAGKTVEFHLYEGAQHAFFNDTRESSYDATASALAWERSQAWFKHYLG